MWPPFYLIYTLLDKGYVNNRTGEKAYSPFGKSCIVFALRNQQNQVTGLYFRSTIDNQNSRHFYLKDRQGLYPGYPKKKEAKKLILTESIIDAATLQQQDFKGYEILALYGTNGLTAEHTEAVSQLKDLKEIIFSLNGDEPGRKATIKHGEDLQQLKPGVKISAVEVPENEGVNSLAQSHESEIFQHLIKERKPLLFSTEITKSEPSEPQPKQSSSQNRDAGRLIAKGQSQYYKGQAANYTVKGLQKGQLDSLKITLFIEHSQSKRKSRSKVDLYEDKQVERVASVMIS